MIKLGLQECKRTRIGNTNKTQHNNTLGVSMPEHGAHSDTSLEKFHTEVKYSAA